MVLVAAQVGVEDNLLGSQVGALEVIEYRAAGAGLRGALPAARLRSRSKTLKL